MVSAFNIGNTLNQKNVDCAKGLVRHYCRSGIDQIRITQSDKYEWRGGKSWAETLAKNLGLNLQNSEINSRIVKKLKKDLMESDTALRSSKIDLSGRWIMLSCLPATARYSSFLLKIELWESAV